MIGNTNTSPSGFTLVEVLIATAVISVVMVLASNLLLLFFQSQSESRDTLYLEAELRQILFRMVEASREGYVDYDFYSTTPDAEPEFLAIRTLAGVQTVFWFYDNGSETNVYICTDVPLDDACSNSVDPELDSSWSQMNPENTRVAYGAFRISPDDPPYLSGGTVSDEAPFVVVRMQLLSEDSEVTSPIVQTSFTPRIYDR
jgi:prepilin-type N-terminal cleavage/methylation domain-containing protein